MLLVSLALIISVLPQRLAEDLMYPSNPTSWQSSTILSYTNTYTYNVPTSDIHCHYIKQRLHTKKLTVCLSVCRRVAGCNKLGKTLLQHGFFEKLIHEPIARFRQSRRQGFLLDLFSEPHFLFLSFCVQSFLFILSYLCCIFLNF